MVSGDSLPELQKHMRNKLNIHTQDFAILLMDKKTYLFHELDDMSMIKRGRRYERRARIIRRCVMNGLQCMKA